MAIDTSKIDLSKIQTLSEVKKTETNETDKTVKNIPKSQEFPYELELQGRKIKFRTWKVKDKENLIKAKTNYDKKKALVFNCLENPNEALDYLEYEYVLFNIRNKSLPNYVTKYVLRCPNCGTVYNCNVHFSDILEKNDRKYAEIKSGNYSIKVGNIKNQEFYENMIMNITDNEQKILIDFILHITEFNSRIDFSAEELIKIFDSMDIETFEDIFKQWNSMRFSYNTIGYCTCPDCDYEDRFDFKDVDNFYPKSWFNIGGI